MSRKNVNYTKKEERTIYILLSKTQKIFLINHCRTESLKETYRKNLLGKRATSKTFINQILPERPCVFELEKVVASKTEAYKYVLVWIKIFIENGYQCFNYQETINQSDDLFLENKPLYEQRKKKKLEEIISCNKCLIPTFKHITCKNYNPNSAEKEYQIKEIQSRKRQNELRIMLHEDEQETIKSNAENLKMKVAPYVRMVAQSPIIAKFNYEALDRHTNEICEVRKSINRLIFTIEASNNYLPREIEEIVRLMEKMFESENKLLRELRKERTNTYEKYRRLLEKNK